MRTKLEETPQAAPDFIEGRAASESLRQRELVTEHVLQHDYDVSMVGGTGAGAVQSDPGFRSLETVEVKIGGKGTPPIHDVRVHTLAVVDAFFYPREFAQVDPSSVAAGADEDDRQAQVRVPYRLLRSRQADQYALPTVGKGLNPQIRVIGGDVADLYTTAIDGAPQYDANTLRLFEEFHDFQRNLSEQQKEAVFGGFGAISLRKKVISESDLNADQALSVELSHLSRGEEIVRIFIEAREGGSSGVGHEPTDALVTQLNALEVDGDVKLEDIPWRLLQNRNKSDYQTGSLRTGVAVLDAIRDGDASRGNTWEYLSSVAPVLDLQIDATATSGDRELVVTTWTISRPAFDNDS